MKTIKVITSLTLLALFALNANASDFIGIKILELSNSKKSAVINYGRLEGLQLGDWAFLYLQDKESDSNHPKLIKVAKAEVIKVHPDRSYWFLREVESYSYLEAGVDLLMQLSSKDKRRELKLRTTKRIMAPNSTSDHPVPSEVVDDKNVDVASAALNQTRSLRRDDRHLERKEEYSVSKIREWNPEFEQDVGSLRIKDPIPENTDGVKKKIEKEVFSSTSEYVVDNINNLPYGKSGLYYETERDATNLSPKYEAGNGLYQQMLDGEKDQKLVSKEALEKMKREGPMYSASMSDAQLRKFFIQSGILEERERQKRALYDRPGSELTFRYTSNLTSHTTAEDPNFQGVNYFISLSYDYQLGRTWDALKKFSSEIELERGVSHYDIGGINARMEEGSLKGYLHWYFWNSASAIKQYVPYLGLGIRRGNASSYSPDLSKDYDWQLLAFPSWRLGVKYRFSSGDERDEYIKIGFGLNFMITKEAVRLNTVNVVEDEIVSSFTTDQMKFSVGLSAYF